MKPFAGKVRDGDYQTLMRSVKARTNPNLALLHYDKPRLVVVDLEVIPQFFFTESYYPPKRT